MYSDSETSKGKYSEENNKGKKLYIGNLPFSVDDASLRNFFEAALGPNTVQTAQVVIDRVRERSKGFGFVVFVSDDIAMKAIALSGQEIQGPDGVARKLSVDEARERAPRSPGGFNRGPRNFGGNDGGGGSRYKDFGGNSGGGYGGGGGFGGNSGGGGYGGGYGGGGGHSENDGGWGRKDNNRRGRGGNSGSKRYDSSDRW